MKHRHIIAKIRSHGIKGSVRYVLKKSGLLTYPDDGIFKILLLTNRDSDNLGDLVIEACDISLLRTIMKNLKVPQESFKIISRAAGIINKQYVATGDPELLENAERLIQSVDLIFFGGAPLFNFKYQIFSERTAITLELAQKYGKPVIFSALGIEEYEAANPKCIHLKEALGGGCVKQITTRDDFESLKQYVGDNDKIIIDKVADPAVYSREVFRKFVSSPPAGRKRKKIGIFILRSGGFKNNGIDFSRDEAAELWLGIISELENLGYDYDLLTSGHFGDEAFLDYLIRNCNVRESKCIFNISSPENLIRKISRYDGVISCRLHPSIISYSLGVPSVAIVWNEKVAQFYDAIGYASRAMHIEDAIPVNIVAALDSAINSDYEKDEGFRMSVYRTMFDAISGICAEKGLLKDETEIYTPEILAKRIVPFLGTKVKAQKKYIVRKMRRTYEHYNKKEPVETPKYSLVYNGGKRADTLTCDYDINLGKTTRLASGSLEYRLSNDVANNGRTRLLENRFSYPGNEFVGWRLRIKNAGVWYWYMDDGNFYPKSNLPARMQKGTIENKGQLPYIPMHDLETAVVEAKWKKL